MYRFYCPDLKEKYEQNINQFFLSQEESHHCINVMRCNIDDRIILFNGEGIKSEVKIIEFSKKFVKVDKVKLFEQKKSKINLVLAQSIIKNKNMDMVIQKATELGVSEIIPIITDRTVVNISGEKEVIVKKKKWKKIAIESCKQSGQDWLPIISSPLKIDNFLNQNYYSNKIYVACSLKEEAKYFNLIYSNWLNNNENYLPNQIVILIGPEGDFSPRELNMILENKFESLSLGETVLRSETASISSISIINYELTKNI